MNLSKISFITLVSMRLETSARLPVRKPDSFGMVSVFYLVFKKCISSWCKGKILSECNALWVLQYYVLPVYSSVAEPEPEPHKNDATPQHWFTGLDLPRVVCMFLIEIHWFWNKNSANFSKLAIIIPELVGTVRLLLDYLLDFHTVGCLYWIESRYS
jgi:hypothetical protein